MKTKYLMASAITGVIEINRDDFIDEPLLSPSVFYSSLTTLQDNEQIFCCFSKKSKDIFDAIEKEYGID